jgi:hypothetical protein
LHGTDPRRVPIEALDYELAQEKASALGRLGRALERALATLAAFDAEHAAPLRAEQRRNRAALVEQAGVALWYFAVQREACGMRDFRVILRDYRVPPEVAARVGALPAPMARLMR